MKHFWFIFGVLSAVAAIVHMYSGQYQQATYFAVYQALGVIMDKLESK